MVRHLRVGHLFTLDEAGCELSVQEGAGTAAGLDRAQVVWAGPRPCGRSWGPSGWCGRGHSGVGRAQVVRAGLGGASLEGTLGSQN